MFKSAWCMFWGKRKHAHVPMHFQPFLVVEVARLEGVLGVVEASDYIAFCKRCALCVDRMMFRMVNGLPNKWVSLP